MAPPEGRGKQHPLGAQCGPPPPSRTREGLHIQHDGPCGLGQHLQCAWAARVLLYISEELKWEIIWASRCILTCLSTDSVPHALCVTVTHSKIKKNVQTKWRLVVNAPA